MNKRWIAVTAMAGALLAGCSSAPELTSSLSPTSTIVLPSPTVEQTRTPTRETSPPATITPIRTTPEGKPTPIPTAQLQWTKMGGPIGGLGYDVRMRQDNTDRMYVTDAWSGVNLSNDGGKTWTASNNGITSNGGPSGDAIPVFSLTISPQNPDVIWAGTQGIRGIFKSTDGGKTWQKKDTGVIENEGLSLRGFTVDPKNPDIVYAAGEISSAVWQGHQQNGTLGFDLVKGVIYKTTDGGEHWNAVWRGDNLARYIIVDPRDSNKLYASTGLFDRDAANESPTGGNLGGVGVLKSTDGGQTWRALNESNGLQNLYVGSLIMNPANPEVLLAGTGVAGPGGIGTKMGAYLSTDGGESWQLVLPEPLSAPISSVEFAQSNPNVAYAGGPAAVFRSNDMGRTWQKQTPGNFWGAAGTRAGFPIDFQVDPRNADRIFANNYGGGNFLSEDGGRTWSVASQGYTGAYLHGIVVNPKDANNIFVIGRTGPFRSSDGGRTWQGLTKEPAVLGGEWYAVAMDPNNPNNVVISDEHQGVIFRSTDSGNNWKEVFRHPGVSVQVMEKRMGFKSIVFAPSNSSVVYAGMELERNQIDQNLAALNNTPSFGVFKSADGGATWRDANDGKSASQNVNMLAVSPDNADIVYAATLKSGILKTTDGGKSWQSMNQGLGGIDVRSIAINPQDPKVLFAGLENGAVYASTDAGSSWMASGSGMDPQAAIRSIVFDPTDSRTVFAADIHSGVFRSDSGGKQWVRVNTGLRTRAVSSMSISSDGSLLFAATQGEGVFRMELATYRR
jgi:photosystem II stability/assembly factor-like uncharacterized protein